MSIARRAAAYVALSTTLAVLATALVAAMPGARAWADQGGLAARSLEPEEAVGEGTEEGEEEGGQAMLVHGRAIPPRNAPREVRRVINAANRIRSKPYIWGGGHGRRWWDRGYDCSGAVGYALHGGGGGGGGSAPNPTSGAAATAVAGGTAATTAPAPSATRCTAAACSKCR